jgi:uncharacterized protein (DUF1810 family)
MAYNLDRFIQAQERDYTTALNEIKTGKKVSHWMWYIFPQLKGLGRSSASNHYGIINLEEAQEYVEHPVLGPNLIEISNTLLMLDSNDAVTIFGNIDSKKLKSCMTLFSSVPGTDPVFERVLVKFFNGKKSYRSLKILGKDLI